MKIGDSVEAVILTLDREERKMSLGIKQLMPDPWSNIDTKYAVNTQHTAKVRNFTNFGVFVELEEGVDGLIHISDLSWQKKIKHPSEFCKTGEAMEVIVLEIDQENRRISLGHKQLEENPWEVFEATFAEGTVHNGTIIEMKDKSGIVSLPYGLEGICPAKHLKKADGNNAGVEEVLDFKVIEFNRDARKIVVSHIRTHEEHAEPATSSRPSRKSNANNLNAINKNAEKSTLGDLDALAELKEKMDKKK
jgi:small subunit ribosomal protein S1